MWSGLFDIALCWSDSCFLFVYFFSGNIFVNVLGSSAYSGSQGSTSFCRNVHGFFVLFIPRAFALDESLFLLTR